MIGPLHIEIALAAGYAGFLIVVASGLEWFGRHSHRRSGQFRTAGFKYHGHLDVWECPCGHHLHPHYRDAVREVVDGRVDIEGRTLFAREVFPPEIEQQFGTTYDKLLRATEGIEYARDLLSAARDYQQARVSIDQNEVVKRLSAIASILLVPTFIVGLYGQNFVNIPELNWHYGYAISLALMLASAVGPYLYFKRRRWI